MLTILQALSKQQLKSCGLLLGTASSDWWRKSIFCR